MKTSTEETLLVIGYGNTLRQDDAAGIRVAERVGALGLPGVRARACRQLLPELVHELAEAPAVVFVDAASDGDGAVHLRPLAEADSGRLDSHLCGPAKLLALAREVCGEAPPAWLRTVPAEHFGFGEELTDTTRRGIDEAVSAVRSLAAEWYY